MNQVFIDTAYKTLTVALLKDNQVVDMVHEMAFKSQSELVMLKLDELLKANALKPHEIDELIVTVGPGSYTGIRIAMTIGKVLGAISPIKIKTATSLELFASSTGQSVVLFDARSQRVYYGLFDEGIYVEGPHILNIDEVHRILSETPFSVYGDGHLVGLEDKFDLNAQAIERVVSKAEAVDDSDHLEPLYLKEASAY